MTKRVSSWVPVPIKSHTIIKNMSSWFDRIITTWALKFFIGEEPKPVFTNRSIICNSSSGMHAQQVQMTKWLKSWTFLCVRGFNNIKIVIQQIKEMFSSSIWGLELHFPVIDDIVTISFLIVIPRYLARIDGQGIEELWNSYQLLCEVFSWVS